MVIFSHYDGAPATRDWTSFLVLAFFASLFMSTGTLMGSLHLHPEISPCILPLVMMMVVLTY
jgi:hypothetical protein